MKIALYVHCFFPVHFYGTEAYTLALAKELLAHDHDVVVVTAVHAGEPAQKSLIEEYTYEGVPVVSIDKNFYPNRSVRDTYEQPAMRNVHERLLRKLAPDVVHVCHILSHTTALLEVTRRLGIPTFATLTDFFGFCYNNVLEDERSRLCAGPDTLRANCIACLLKLAAAQPHADALTRLGGMPYLRTKVADVFARLGQREANAFSINGFAPNDLVLRPAILHRAMGVYREAIAPTRFLKQAYEANAFPAPMRLSHFGIEIDRSAKPPRAPDAPVRLGFIGQLVRHKGTHLLIEALGRAQRSNLTLTVWGSHEQDRAYFNGLVVAAADLPVTFPGTIPRTSLADALATIDYLVIPSTWYENSPLILLQALATHTPAIVSDVLGMTEFVAHGENGFHFARGDVDSLTAVLRQVADDPPLAERLSAQTRYERIPGDMGAGVLALYADHDLPWTAPPARPAAVAGTGPVSDDPLDVGIEGELEPWLHFNAWTAFESPEHLARVAPFAPRELIGETTGLDREQDFASHGADILRALAAASDRPLNAFRSWLDFGVGVGRVARLFKGFTGDFAGVDVDARNIAWLRESLPWVHAVRTVPGLRLPFADQRFDAVVSISVFTHMDARDQDTYLAELHRVTHPGGLLFITVHGETALARARADGKVLDLLSIAPSELDAAEWALSEGDGLHFVRQDGHLTTEDYAYGITFVSRKRIDAVWTQWFDVVSVQNGGIHGFQDVVTLRRR